MARIILARVGTFLLITTAGAVAGTLVGMAIGHVFFSGESGIGAFPTLALGALGLLVGGGIGGIVGGFISVRQFLRQTGRTGASQTER